MLFRSEKDRLKDALDAEHSMLQSEQQRSERLLLNVLPGHIAERLKHEQGVIADSLADCTVMFADLTDFTRIAEEMPPREMLDMLNELFSWFDNLANQYGLEKSRPSAMPTWWPAASARAQKTTRRRSGTWRLPCVICCAATSPPIRDRKSTRLNSSHSQQSRMPSSA